MTITAKCPQCGKSGTAPREAIGRTATCKGCGTKFVVKDADEEDAPPIVASAKPAAAKPAAPKPAAAKGSDWSFAKPAASPAEVRSPVAVVGDPAHGLDKVVAFLNKQGIATGKLGEGPTVQPVVIVNDGTDGPSPAWREAVIACGSHAVYFLGLVYTAVDEDEGTREMFEDQLLQTIKHFNPSANTDLKIWQLDDPALAKTIAGLLQSTPQLAKRRDSVTLKTPPKPVVDTKPPPRAPAVKRTSGKPIAGPPAWLKVPNWTTSTAAKASGEGRLTDPRLEFLIQYFNSKNNRNPDNKVAIDRVVQALAKFNRGDGPTAAAELSKILQMPGLAKELVAKAYQCRGIIRAQSNEADASIDDFSQAIEASSDELDLAWSLLWRGRACARAGHRESAQADFRIVAGMQKLNGLPYTEAIRAAAETDLREVS